MVFIPDLSKSKKKERDLNLSQTVEVSASQLFARSVANFFNSMSIHLI